MFFLLAFEVLFLHTKLTWRLQTTGDEKTVWVGHLLAANDSYHSPSRVLLRWVQIPSIDTKPECFFFAKWRAKECEMKSTQYSFQIELKQHVIYWIPFPHLFWQTNWGGVLPTKKHNAGEEVVWGLKEGWDLKQLDGVHWKEDMISAHYKWGYTECYICIHRYTYIFYLRYYPHILYISILIYTCILMYTCILIYIYIYISIIPPKLNMTPQKMGGLADAMNLFI